MQFGAWIGNLEGEAGGEGGGGVGSWVGELDWEVEHDGAGAGRRRVAAVSVEADGTVSEIGVTEEGEVI